LRSSDVMFALGRTVRVGVREYLVEQPPRVLAGAVAPRAVLQVVFLTVLGQAVAGPGGAVAAGLGACAFAIVTATVVKAPDVLINERHQGTLHRLRLTELPLPGLVVARWVVYGIEGFVSAVLAVPLVALITGDGRVLRALPALLPLFAVVVVTTSGYGLAVAVLALGRRADVFLANMASYLVLALGGVLVPLAPGTLRAHLGALLPLSHGAAALRHVVESGRPAGPDVLAELLVGLAWWTLALAGMRIQAVRSRRLGSDFRF